MKEYMRMVLKYHEKNLLDEEYRYAYNGMRLPLELDLEETRLLIKAVKNMTKQQIAWVPIKVRELTYEERENYSDDEHRLTWECPIPNDGEEVLITLTNGIVDMTTFYNDYYDCFEGYEWEDIKAWARKPKPYKEETESEE